APAHGKTTLRNTRTRGVSSQASKSPDDGAAATHPRVRGRAQVNDRSMIVRINQFDPANAEPYSGWEPDEIRGPMQFDWPAATHAFELLILENDERQQMLPLAFRQAQLRQLLPDVVQA